MNIAETIKQISQKKDFISEHALKAKEEYDRLKEEGTRQKALGTSEAQELEAQNKDQNITSIRDESFWSSIKINPKLVKITNQNQIEKKIPTEIIQPNYVTEIRDFNESIAILNDIIKSTKIDELTYLLTNPIQLFIMNFFIGLVRGISFAIGFLLIILALGYIFFINLPSNYVGLILEKLF